MVYQILQQFGIQAAAEPQHFGSGHINKTFLVDSAQGKYILQQVNTQVFQNPEAIALNLRTAGEYLKKNAPEFLFIQPVSTLTGEDYVLDEGRYWRLLPYVPKSYTMNEVADEAQAYAAARTFGLLTRHLNGLDVSHLEETIPRFHDLRWRYEQFKEAQATGVPHRREEAAEWVAFFETRKHIVETFDALMQNPDFPTRLIHHDTKINNVLFNETTGKAITVCDLDTLMPGRIISDIGDMHRTYLSEAGEGSTDFDRVKVRKSFYDAVMQGYLSALEDVLTPTEKAHLHYGGEYIIYMQGLRFLTDYLNGDTYYPTAYPTQNLDRAINQAKLLEDFEQMK